MTKVFFYHGMDDRLAYAARLIQGAWAQKKAMTLYANGALAEQLDRLLWEIPNTGFVPHCFGDSPLAQETPVVIARNAHELATPTQTQRLINLSDDLPPDFERFDSLVEVVSQDDATRLAGRDRVRLYRERGIEVQFKDTGAESHGG